MKGVQRTSIPGPPIYRIALVQFAVLALIAFVALVLVGTAWAISVFAGAMIEALPRLYFGYCAFRYRGARQIRQVAQSFRRGELGKFVLVAVMFGGLFVGYRSVVPEAVFAGYVVSWLLGMVLSARWLR